MNIALPYGYALTPVEIVLVVLAGLCLAFLLFFPAISDFINRRRNDK